MSMSYFGGRLAATSVKFVKFVNVFGVLIT